MVTAIIGGKLWEYENGTLHCYIWGEDNWVYSVGVSTANPEKIVAKDTGQSVDSIKVLFG